MMTAGEHAVVFGCAGEPLVGVLHVPPTPADTAVVVIVGGPQYRAGSHRQFVLLARALAGAGYAVLRFDYRGMGDSSGPQRSFQAVSADIGVAIDALQSRLPNVQHVALWGLCDGASAALLYRDATRDPRVAGLCVLNPWVRSEASLARTQVKHYYRQRLMQRDFWIKLVTGKVAAGALNGLLRNVAKARRGGGAMADTSSFQDRMADAWCSFEGSILLLSSGADFTAKEFAEYTSGATRWANAWRHPRLTKHVLDGADHTFSNASARSWVETHTLEWLGSFDAVHVRRSAVWSARQ